MRGKVIQTKVSFIEWWDGAGGARPNYGHRPTVSVRPVTKQRQKQGESQVDKYQKMH